MRHIIPFILIFAIGFGVSFAVGQSSNNEKEKEVKEVEEQITSYTVKSEIEITTDFDTSREDYDVVYVNFIDAGGYHAKAEVEISDFIYDSEEQYLKVYKNQDGVIQNVEIHLSKDNLGTISELFD